MKGELVNYRINEQSSFLIENKEAATDAWEKVKAWLEKYLVDKLIAGV